MTFVPMTRAERRQRAAVRQGEIILRLADIAKAEMAAGRTWAEAVVAADRWLAGEVKRRPQERSAYLAAVHEFSRRIAEGVKAERQRKLEESPAT